MEALQTPMATHTATGAETASLKALKQPTLLPLRRQSNACKRRLPGAKDGAILNASTQEAPEWTTRHPATCQKHADCRPLLQQSSPNRGQVVQSGMTRKGITSRLQLCA